jgi:hypothetical protein
VARKASRPVAVERVRVRWWIVGGRPGGRDVGVIWGVGLGGILMVVWNMVFGWFVILLCSSRKCQLVALSFYVVYLAFKRRKCK